MHKHRFTSLSALQQFRKLHAKLFQIKTNKQPNNIQITIQESRQTNKGGGIKARHEHEEFSLIFYLAVNEKYHGSSGYFNFFFKLRDP